MSTKLLTFMLMVVFALMLAFVGCSDDDSNPATSSSGTADTTELNLIDIAQVIKDVAPPVYAAPILKSSPDSFEIWTEGDYPLLYKVFGEDDPQTLYRNVEFFEMFMDMIDGMLLVDENGDLIPGTFTEAHTDTIDGQEITRTGTCTVSALTTATAIPTACQGILGTSHDLDYLVEVSIEEMPEAELQIGFKLSETEQTMLVFQANMSGIPGDTESSITYASLDPSDSTFVFKGFMYCTHSEGAETFTTSFIMTSENTGDFSYRMSWYSDGIPDSDLLGCIIGGGNKDTEFALKYRQYTPADAAEYDAEWAFDEVFGPNYTNGTGLITDYATFVNEALIIGYDLVPHAVVPNPWAE